MRFDTNTLFASNVANENDNNLGTKRIKRWDGNKVQTFIDGIDLDRLANLENYLDGVDSNSISQDDINHIVDKVNKIILDSAENALGSYTLNTSNKCKVTKENKPWFDKFCWEKRKCFRIAKRRYNTYKTDAKLQIMRKAEKEYKHQMNISIKSHKKEFRKKMKNMKNSDPKTYWNILNNKNGKREQLSGISTESLFDFFRDLNSALSSRRR